MHKNMFNNSTPQDQKNLDISHQNQGTHVNWQHANDPRLHDTQFSTIDINNLSTQFGKNDTNNYTTQLSVNEKNDYGAQFNVNDSSNNNAQFYMNNTKNHDGSYVDTINSPSTNASQNHFNEIHKGPRVEFYKQSPCNDTNVGFNFPNINTSYYPQGKINDVNNQNNVSQEGLLPNFGLHENTSNPIYNNQRFLQEQGLNFQGTFQEHGSGSNVNSQGLSNPRINLHNILQEQGSMANLDVQKNNHSTINSPPKKQFNPYSNHEISNVESKSQNYLQKMPTPNPTSHGNINNRDENFHSNISMSEGSLSNSNCTLTPFGMNSTCSPHSILPTLNITFSPTFDNSTSTMPTTPKSQNLQNFNMSHPLETNIPYNHQTNLLGSQFNAPNKTYKVPISTYDIDPSLNSQKDPQHSKKHHYKHGEALTSTSNSNPTRDKTTSPSSQYSHSENYSTSDLVQNVRDHEDFHASALKSKNQKKCLRKQSQDLDDWNSDSDYDESSTPPNTRKKILHLTSKKLKCLRSFFEDNNDVDVDNIPMWIQKTIVLPTQHYGCHNITPLVCQYFY